MYCPKCGDELESGSEFCTVCGAKIADAGPAAWPETPGLPTPTAGPGPESAPQIRNDRGVALNFSTRLSSVLGSLTVFFILFTLIAKNIDFFQLPAIVFGISIVFTLGISYSIVRYLMVKFPSLTIPVIIIFICYMLYSFIFNNGNVASRLSFGTDPVMAIIALVFVVGLFYVITGYLFEKEEDSTGV